MTAPATITNGNSNSNEGALWRIVLSEYERIEAAYNVVSAEHDEQTAAFYRELGEETGDRFDKYPTIRSSRPREERISRTAILMLADEYPQQDATPEQFGEITKRAAQLVDDAEAFRVQRDAIYDRTIGAVEKRWEAALDELYSAREKLIATPAPDANAMLYKLEVLAAEMIDADTDDTDSVVSLRDDARRLFGGR